jgi:low temperature requirement protein LtrA
MADRTAEHGQRVTTLELFFDLVLVSAFTQVTRFLSHDPTWEVSSEGCSSSARSGGPGRGTPG